ncbi:MAG: flavin reductase family protein [Kiritimatiellia bacterium]|nr:flavin reductase family protein [Kiritimatiellia bacterium]
MTLQPLNLDRLDDSAVRLFGKDWALFTAGSLVKWNTMTIAWGGLGTLWNRPVCWTYIRPTRHTFEFAEQAESFSLCFFEETWRPALQICGTKSGREIDKAATTGLRPAAAESGTVYFEQARLVLDCRKIYSQDLDPSRFLDPDIEKHYPLRDYHRLYIGEIRNAWSLSV